MNKTRKFKGNHGCMITNGDFGHPIITNGNNSGNSTRQSMVRRVWGRVGLGSVVEMENVSNRKGWGRGGGLPFFYIKDLRV
jgi:hypothetical protein